METNNCFIKSMGTDHYKIFHRLTSMLPIGRTNAIDANKTVLVRPSHFWKRNNKIKKYSRYYKLIKTAENIVSTRV